VALLNEAEAQAYTQQTEAQYYQAALAALNRTHMRTPAMAHLRELASELFGRAS
jgi:geranylgeranyl pyrophosphate synthase